MWPSPAIALTNIQESESGIDLLVGQTSFPFIAGLKDEKISKLYKEQGIEKPSPALAVCTYALTQDGQLTLTVRGNRTNMYPGRIYGQEGSPHYTNVDLVEHQTEEMKDEILIQPNECDASEMKFSGIVIDKEQLMNKPDLVGWVSVNLDSDQIRERVRNRELRQRPNDAVDVLFAPATEGGLFDYLAKKTHPIQYCPPAHGGLVLFGHHNFGKAWSDGLLKMLEYR